MKLTTMTANAVKRCAHEYEGWNPSIDESMPPKSVVAKLEYELLFKEPNLGKLGLRDIATWLAEDGLSIRNMPAKRGVSNARIEDAISLLEKHGYTVKPPK